MSATEILVKARKLIDSPEKWIQGAYASQTEKGICYCSAGALNFVSDKLLYEAEAENFLLEAIKKFKGYQLSIVEFNDDPIRTHEQVMQVWDDAIDMSKR